MDGEQHRGTEGEPVALRIDFRQSLQSLEDAVLEIGRTAEELIVPATEGLLAGDPAVAERILLTDDVIDQQVHRAEDGIHRQIMLQAPVADDLRLLLSLLQVARSVERIGDYALNVARLAGHVVPEDADDDLAAQVRQLALDAERAVRVSLDCFGRRDPAGVGKVEEVESRIDRLHDGVTRRLMAYAGGGAGAMGWSVRMIQAAGHLERIGDHAVGIGARGAFVATGRRRPPRAER